MSRKNKIIFLVISCLLAIFLLIWFLIRPQATIMRQGLNTNAPSLPQSGGNTPSPANTNQILPKTEEPKSNTEITIKSLASAFSERYGSFSNQTDFKNLRDLYSLMTDKFSAQNDEYIKEQKKKSGDTTVYYGVTSKTVKNKLISLNEEETVAVARLTMQRREARESMNSNVRVSYQDIIVELEKERGEWKISNAEWQNLK
ncbi:MAG: hypothetical protein ABIC82_00085 [bacterium]